MIQIFSKVQATFRTLNKFKIHSYECHLDDKTKRAYLIITPTYKHIPIKYFLDELVNDHKLLKKLEFNSLKYVFSTYGIIKSQAKNNFFTIVEILISDEKILVQNLSSLTREIWDKGIFEAKYVLLDKKSLKQASEYFATIHHNIIDTNKI